MVQTQITFRAEFRTKGSKEEWRPYHGTVRLPQDDGAITKPTTVSESAENIREAIAQWDSVERYEWNIIGRETTWHEWVEPPESANEQCDPGTSQGIRSHAPKLTQQADVC